LKNSFFLLIQGKLSENTPLFLVSVVGAFTHSQVGATDLDIVDSAIHGVVCQKSKVFCM
jgi:hypothetical protein